MDKQTGLKSWAELKAKQEQTNKEYIKLKQEALEATEEHEALIKEWERLTEEDKAFQADYEKYLRDKKLTDQFVKEFAEEMSQWAVCENCGAEAKLNDKICLCCGSEKIQPFIK